MVLKFNHNNETQTQYADILLKKIKVCISMNTMGRIMQFGLYYSEMFYKIIEKNLTIWENMEKEHKKEKMRNKLMKKKSNIIMEGDSSDSDSDIDDENDIKENEDLEKSDGNKIFDDKFASQLAEDINKKKEKDNEDEFIIDTSSKKDKGNDNEINIIDSQSNIIINKNNDNNDIEKNAEENLKNKEIKLSKIFRTKNKKINIKIKLELRETSLLFPLDDTKSVTKVIRCKSNINGNVYLNTNFDLIRDGNTKLVKINFNENKINTGMKILNVELGILDYQNGIYSIDNIYDKILTGFRLCLNINSFLLLPQKEQTLTLVNIDLEPIVFNISFTHIKAFIKFIPILTEFLGDMKRGYDDPSIETDSRTNTDLEEDMIYNNNIIDNKIDNIIKESDSNIISTSTKNSNIDNDEDNEIRTDTIKIIENEKIKKRKHKKKKKNKNKKEKEKEKKIILMKSQK
jgi:hypothetical protein